MAEAYRLAREQMERAKVQQAAGSDGEEEPVQRPREPRALPAGVAWVLGACAQPAAAMKHGRCGAASQRLGRARLAPGAARPVRPACPPACLMATHRRISLRFLSAACPTPLQPRAAGAPPLRTRTARQRTGSFPRGRGSGRRSRRGRRVATSRGARAGSASTRPSCGTRLPKPTRPAWRTWAPQKA